jgi:Zn-finger nucleic acid-binding protein
MRAALPLRCPHCGLVLTPRQTSIAPLYCPRCLARYRRAIELEKYSTRVDRKKGAKVDRRRRHRGSPDLGTTPERDMTRVAQPSRGSWTAARSGHRSERRRRGLWLSESDNTSRASDLRRRTQPTRCAARSDAITHFCITNRQNCRWSLTEVPQSCSWLDAAVTGSAAGAGDAPPQCDEHPRRADQCPGMRGTRVCSGDRTGVSSSVSAS